jgi:hypothetical protein
MAIIRIGLRELRKILREEILLEEENKATDQPGEDSIDMQIDRYFMDFETEARSLKKEGRDWHRTMRRLMEADEDESEDEKEDEGEKEEKKPEKGTADDIEIESFVNGIIRLIDNYDSLLEVRNTILRRASNFLNKNYDTEVVDAFHGKLKDDHGMEIGKSRDEYFSDNFSAPISDRAGGGGGGGGA